MLNFFFSFVDLLVWWFAIWIITMSFQVNDFYSWGSLFSVLASLLWLAKCCNLHRFVGHCGNCGKQIVLWNCCLLLLRTCFRQNPFADSKNLFLRASFINSASFLFFFQNFFNFFQYIVWTCRIYIVCTCNYFREFLSSLVKFGSFLFCFFWTCSFMFFS